MREASDVSVFSASEAISVFFSMALTCSHPQYFEVNPRQKDVLPPRYFCLYLCRIKTLKTKPSTIIVPKREQVSSVKHPVLIFLTLSHSVPMLCLVLKAYICGLVSLLMASHGRLTALQSTLLSGSVLPFIPTFLYSVCECICMYTFY